MQTIKAAVCHAFGDPLRIEDIHLRAPEMGEVEVTVDAVAICHSDISYARVRVVRTLRGRQPGVLRNAL